MKLNSTFIRNELNSSGMKVSDLAYLCDVSCGYMSNLLNHKEVPSSNMIKKLMEIFCVSYNTITTKGKYNEEKLIRGNRKNRIHCDKLIALLDKEGLLQKDFAKILEVSQAYTNMICNGKERPSTRILNKICNLFDLNINDLLVNTPMAASW